MSHETYQAIYDAVRSKIAYCDLAEIVAQSVRDANLGHYAEMMKASFEWHLSDCRAPSVLFRPEIFIDGNKWCALYGKNLQEGVAGFGDSPALAMADFDKHWTGKLPGDKP